MRPYPGPPPAPEALEGEALLEWQRIVAELEPARVLTKADRAALVVYCLTWAQMQDAAANIAKTGSIIKLPNGYPGPTPYLKVYHTCARLCTRLLAEFGATPSGRARIPGPAGGGNADDDEIEI